MLNSLLAYTTFVSVGAPFVATKMKRNTIFSLYTAAFIEPKIHDVDVSNRKAVTLANFKVYTFEFSFLV